MAVRTKNFPEILSDQAAAAQASASASGIFQTALNFTEGSLFRAFAEAVGVVALWLQAEILDVLRQTRAATSRADELDTWMADYGLTRSAAQVAGGAVQFSRFTPALPALVPVGALVRTADRGQTFTVMADDAHAAWDATLNGYRMPPGMVSISVPVRGTAAGAAGNVLAGTVTLLASAIPGVDTVTNAAPFTGGTDAESDAAMRSRFVAYLASLARATPEAIRFAIDQVRPGLTFALIEGEMPDGTPRDAYFQVIVDDGSGTPSAELLSLVASSVENYRPIGVDFVVVAPLRTIAAVQMTIATEDSAEHPEVVALVQNALLSFINSLPIGAGLPYTRLSQIAYAASPLVRNVTGVLLNGSTNDIVVSNRRAIRAGTISVV